VISSQSLFNAYVIGQEAVDWMMLHMGLKSRQIVCNLGTRLVAQELIHCISKGTLFLAHLGLF
jgi:hypothetical protein